MKKHFLLILILLLSTLSSYAKEQPIESLYVINQENTFQVAFGFNYLLIEEGTNFGVNVFLEGENLFLKQCSQQFNDISGIYGKVTCSIEKQGDGEYSFQGYLEIEDEIISLSVQDYALFGTIGSSYQFREVEGGTQIQISVEGVGENVQVLSRIPKEVIELLTPENQDSLVFSELPYEIIEADPLIAWNVGKIPTDINYTIRKNISPEDKNNFGVQIRESEDTHIFTYFIFILLLVILVFVFKPIFKKK